MRAIASMMALAIIVTEARADPSFALDPAQAHEGQIVSLRVEDPSLCTPFGAPTITRDGNVVKASFLIDDASVPGQCVPGHVAPRTHALGTFTNGIYHVDVEYCPAPPIPCTTPASLVLTVLGGTGTRFTVPALSGAVAIGLVFAMVAIGAVSLQSDWRFWPR